MGNAPTASALGLLALLLAPGASAGTDWLAEGRAAVVGAKTLHRHARAKNAILFVGDGMGLTTVTAARILEGQLRGETGEENQLSFETLPHVALLKTYNTNQQVPDSAGTMTAMVAGAKTRAGAISVDETVALGDAAAVAGHELRTLFEEAEDRGLSTGVVTNTRITHATPAACYGHSPTRDWESDADLSRSARWAGFPDLARQLVEFSHGDGIEVALGGGRAAFLPTSTPDPEHTESKGSRRDGRDLTAEWAKKGPGSAYVWDLARFREIDPAKTRHLLGLFQPSHMQFEIDRSKDRAGEPSLTEMTNKALDMLERNEKGFVLMVEGGRIDHAHHLGNAHRALTDAIEFARAVRAAMDRTDRSDTLIIVTADHGHVFTIAGYPKRGNPILGKVVGNDRDGEPSDEPTLDAHGLPYTTLGYHNGPGAFAVGLSSDAGSVHRDLGQSEKKVRRGRRPDLSHVDTEAPDYLQEAAVPMRSETHSAEDVVVYAGGPGAHLFHGVQEQSYVYHVLVDALGWR